MCRLACIPTNLHAHTPPQIYADGHPKNADGGMRPWSRIPGYNEGDKEAMDVLRAHMVAWRAELEPLPAARPRRPACSSSSSCGGSSSSSGSEKPAAAAAARTGMGGSGWASPLSSGYSDCSEEGMNALWGCEDAEDHDGAVS